MTLRYIQEPRKNGLRLVRFQILRIFRQTGLRFKDADGKTKLAHTLNGSALALPRIVAALLENNQTSEGIKIPEALIPYTGFEIID